MQVEVVTGFPPQPDIIVPLLSHTFTARLTFVWRSCLNEAQNQ